MSAWRSCQRVDLRGSMPAGTVTGPAAAAAAAVQ